MRSLKLTSRYQKEGTYSCRRSGAESGSTPPCFLTRRAGGVSRYIRRSHAPTCEIPQDASTGSLLILESDMHPRSKPAISPSYPSMSITISEAVRFRQTRGSRRGNDHPSGVKDQASRNFFDSFGSQAGFPPRAPAPKPFFQSHVNSAGDRLADLLPNGAGKTLRRFVSESPSLVAAAIETARSEVRRAALSIR